MFFDEASERGGADSTHGLRPRRKLRQYLLQSGLAAALRRRKDDEQRRTEEKVVRMGEHNPKRNGVALGRVHNDVGADLARKLS